MLKAPGLWGSVRRYSYIIIVFSHKPYYVSLLWLPAFYLKSLSTAEMFFSQTFVNCAYQNNTGELWEIIEIIFLVLSFCENNYDDVTMPVFGAFL